jgi:hypothetical protein
VRFYFGVLMPHFRIKRNRSTQIGRVLGHFFHLVRIDFEISASHNEDHRECRSFRVRPATRQHRAGGFRVAVQLAVAVDHQSAAVDHHPEAVAVQQEGAEDQAAARDQSAAVLAV